MSSEASETKLDVLAEHLRDLSQLLFESHLEPNPKRTDWSGLGGILDTVRKGADELLASLEPALMEAEDTPGLRERIRARVADITGRAAAVLHLAGNTAEATRLLREAARISPGQGVRAQYDAALREPEMFVRLRHALWLNYHGKGREADRRLRALIKESKEEGLQEIARQVLAGPRPVESAPSLFTVNGCGLRLYGSRDRDEEDGSYVTNHCLCIIFIPVVPLAAYRVREVESGRYQFLARERLGPIASKWRAAVAACAVLLVGWIGVSSYLDSPDRLAGIALEKAQAVEQSGQREKAIDAYRELLGMRPGREAHIEASKGLIRLNLANLQTPCTRDSVDPAHRSLLAYNSLRDSVLQEHNTNALIDRLDQCATQVGTATPADITASMEVLGFALSAATKGTPRHTELKERRQRIGRTQADALRAEQPLRALVLYTSLGDDAESTEAARALIDGFGPSPSLWLEMEPVVTEWVEAHRGTEAERAAGDGFKARLEAARKQNDADEKLIASGDEALLTKALDAQPQDQELAVAVAQHQRERGEAKQALATLARVGSQGRMTAPTRLLFAACERDLGMLAEADQHLTLFVQERLRAFQDAQRDYDSAAEGLQNQLVARARSGNLPEEILRKLKGASSKEQPEIFRTWLIAQLNQDPELEKKRAEYMRHEPVVPAALTLGIVKLQRAAGQTGEARNALLREAEAVFLSIRKEASDNPRFHLGLGQVYHRLGRTAEGDQEFQSLLARKDSGITLDVAHAYRELGLDAQARALCKEVHETAPEPEMKHSAAALCSRLAQELEEEEKWLRLSDTSSPYVKVDLTRLEARRALRDGRYADSDRALAQVTAFYDRGAKHDAVDANNSATAYMSRYYATGNLAHLRTAVERLETAARLTPDNALVLSNFAGALEYLGRVRVLDKFVRTSALWPATDECQTILTALIEGPMRGEVLKALAADPFVRRSREVAQQEQVLAPQDPGSYTTEVQWLTWNHDAAGLGALARRLESLPAFDGSSEGERRRTRATGEQGTRNARNAAQAVSLAEQAVERARQTGHKPTQAAAALHLGDMLTSQLPYENTPAKIEAVAATYRQALQLWPGAGLETTAGSELWMAAGWSAAQRSPALARVLKEDWPEYGFNLAIHRALEQPLAEELRKALRAEPLLREATGLMRRRVTDAPTVEAWIIARAAGDAELERASAQAFSRADLSHAIAIEARLYGGLPREKAMAELFEKGHRAVATDTP
ncbi:hypothetical protein P2318_18485 [Myxococcaceae bacterium GXIMD 01537]